MSLVERFKERSVLIQSLLRQTIIQGNVKIAEAFAQAGEVANFSPGEVLIHEGGMDRDLYFLLAGKVVPSVKGQRLTPREKGQTVGEMSAVNPLLTRAATVTALESTVTLKVSPAVVESVAELEPRIYLHIAAELASRLEERNSLIRPPNARPRIFFISSKESLKVAKAIRHGLKYTDSDSLIWSDDDIFPPGSYPLEVLEREVDLADFGVAIAHPDDLVRSRDRKSAAPRDNVIFELGFFMSRLGRKRTYLLLPKSDAELKLPSDFKGMTPIMYPPLKETPGEVPSQTLHAPIYELEQLIEQLGCRLRLQLQP